MRAWQRPILRQLVLVWFAAWAVAAQAVIACPVDEPARPAEQWLTVRAVGAPAQAYTAAQLAALPPTTLTQRLSVSAALGAGTERTVQFAGVLLRDVLLHAGFGGPADRAARGAIIELVATDGYRARFSWGELFNTAVGDQVLVIQSQDGRPLDATAGPLALRSLADLRPGPRHVRNLCAVVILRP